MGLRARDMPTVQIRVRNDSTQSRPYNAALVELDTKRRQYYIKRKQEQPEACTLIVCISPFSDEEREIIKESIRHKGDEAKRYHVFEGPLYYSEVLSDCLRTQRAIDRDERHMQNNKPQ